MYIRNQYVVKKKKKIGIKLNAIVLIRNERAYTQRKNRTTIFSVYVYVMDVYII